MTLGTAINEKNTPTGDENTCGNLCFKFFTNINEKNTPTGDENFAQGLT